MDFSAFKEANGQWTRKRDEVLVGYVNSVAATRRLTLRGLLGASWSLVAPRTEAEERALVAALGGPEVLTRAQDALASSPAVHATVSQPPSLAQILSARFELLRLFNASLCESMGLLELSAWRTPRSPAANLSACASILFDLVKRVMWEEALLRSRVEGSTRLELVLDFGRAMARRGSSDGRHSVFAQAFRALRGVSAAKLRLHGKVYRATLRGMGSHDDGGPYRQSFSQYCAELQSIPGVGLLLPCANHVNDIHINRDKWLPDPSAKSGTQLAMFEFLGQLMGIAIRNKEYLDLRLPSLVWKQLANQCPTLEDLRAVDLLAVSNAERLELLMRDSHEATGGMDAEAYFVSADAEDYLAPDGTGPLYEGTSDHEAGDEDEDEQSVAEFSSDAEGDHGLTLSPPRRPRLPESSRRAPQSSSSEPEAFYFTTFALDGSIVELCPRGALRRVTPQNVAEWKQLHLAFKLHEFDLQVDAMRRGLATIVPQRMLTLFTADEVELMVCGHPRVDLALLREMTVYSDCQATDPHVLQFWRVLEGFTEEERAAYVRFVWGRSRLPVNRDHWKQPHRVATFYPPRAASLDHSGERGGTSARGNDDDYLPFAHTCYFTIDVPRYSSEAVMRRKLLFAIQNCTEIDGDQTSAGRRAAAMGFDILGSSEDEDGEDEEDESAVEEDDEVGLELDLDLDLDHIMSGDWVLDEF